MIARNQLNLHEEAPSKTDVSMIFSLLFGTEPSPSEQMARVRPTIKAESLQAWLDESLAENPNTSGAVALVDIPGQIDWLAAAGSVDAGLRSAMTIDSRFVFSRLSEPLIATLVLQLVEKNKLRLTEPVHHHLDKHLLDLLTDGHGYQLTVQQLLNHTSGIADYRQLEGTETATDLMQRVQLCLEQAVPYAVPGQGYYPAATNYALLGLVLEAVEEQALEELLQQRILDPFGMQQTTIGADPILGMEGTAADLRRFIHALASGLLVHPNTTLQQMLVPGPGNYGLGVQCFDQAPNIGKIWGAIGSNPEFSIYMMYVEKYDAIFIYGAKHFYGPMHNPRFFTDLILNQLWY